MAVVSKRAMSNNPYRRQASPMKNPFVIFGAMVVLVFFLMTIFPSESPATKPTSGLRVPNAAEKEEQGRTKPETTNEAETPERIPEPDEDGNGEMKLQQPIVHDEEEKKHTNEAIHVEAMETFDLDKNQLYFHHYKRGKSGVVIEDMLMAHAHAFHMGGTYGGCCIEAGVKIERHQELLDALGLREALPFRCPGDVNEPGVRKSIIQKEKYHGEDTRIWTPAYVSYLRSLVSYPVRNDDEFVIVAHIRRGDVTPCKKQNRGYDRYLPNQHFLNVIDMYNKPDARVEIITESNSFESLDVFREKGYQIKLDEDLASIWKTFISADVVILSRSDFSMIPAVCSMGKVVYTPFWHAPIRGWDRVPKEIMEGTNAELQRLKEESC